MGPNGLVEFLSQVTLFESLKGDRASLQAIAEMVTHKKIKKGQPVITEGEDGEDLFILYKGTVEICKNTLDKELYTVVKLGADKHAFFGELALLDNDKRSATVVADSDCELLVINKKDFLKFGDFNPKIGLLITRKISQNLAQKLRRANQDVITLFEALVGEIEADR